VYERGNDDCAAGLFCVAEDNSLSQRAGADFIPLFQPSRVLDVIIFLLSMQHMSSLLII
jgi:hypothetical protein